MPHSEWERYAPYALLGVPEGHLGEVWNEDLLIDCLDGVLRNKYKSTILRTLSLSFMDVREELRRLSRIPNLLHWRVKWGDVQLKRNVQDIKIQD